MLRGNTGSQPMLRKRVFDSGTFNYLKIVQTLVISVDTKALANH